MFQELKEDTLQEVVSSNAKVYVQFSAGWCGNCRIMKPKFKKMGNESEDTYIVIDAEKNPESRKLANVDNLPTFAFFKDGKFVNQVQTNKVDSLKTFIDETTTN